MLEGLEEGMLNDPGVAYRKGGLALMLAALTAFETSPRASRLGYEVVINRDEAVGSPSSARLIEQAAQGKIAALTYEPALTDGTLAGARAGSGNYYDHVKGKRAQAGHNAADDQNEIDAA